ncbi:class I lanthipeptide [Chitinophaga nivalis]|uniref:Class I lanthipeptide n=1 Tax=Chitinophaga nivalis TaxID=2991709 RepID=A0ABT3IJF9_9BACT|nr:class I lanthipeptide [Chitinophaga nivalis]MCW3466213.1 class I lanthipeptide [Chitinophaga nivalis]MCW3484096.1 class I lanthipeptide [Chitinophaga nivalis]
MKKKKLSLNKKLLLQKEAVLDLNKQQQDIVLGGVGRTLNANCATWDPAATCESIPKPGRVCL